MRYLIVSRHPAAIDFIRQSDARFADAPVLASATADDVAGAIVAGNLPLHLAAVAREVVAVEFEGQPPRGQEYDLEAMRNAGARLRSYVVIAATAGAVEQAVADLVHHGSGSTVDGLRELAAARR